MDVLVGYYSALEYWRLVGPGFMRDCRTRREATCQARQELARAEKPCLAEGNRRPAGCTLPLQVLVGDASARTKTKGVISHTWTSLPDNALIDAGQGFYMSTPEFCFLQMASAYSLAQLIQLGCELCGTYALVEDGPAVTRDAPLTTVARLRAFVEAAKGMPGRTKALRALAYLSDRSASPMETVVALMLYLPYNLGGYGLKRPSLNYRVDVPRHLSHLADRGFCVCDLYWAESKLAVEYDSKLHHTDIERRQSDARRRNLLISLGYTVVTVSPDQVMDSGSFNRLAHQLAKLIGKRLRYEDPKFTRAHLRLREELFEIVLGRASA